MTHRIPSHCRAFTLIELSIVVLVLGLLVAAAMRYANSTTDSNSLAATNNTLNVVETALRNFQNDNSRLPCPADLTQAENTAAFGTEVYAATTGGALGDGYCGYLSSANKNAAYGAGIGGLYINSGTDPDAAGGSDNNYGGAADPLYDSTTVSMVVQGGIPTKTLRLPDKYAYDSWGNKLFYVVDIRMTASGAFATYNVTNSVVGAIAVKNTATDTLANAISYKGIYALVSTGKNQHGGFVRNLSATSTRVSSGSTNTDELDNCHCNTNANTTTFNRIFVQKSKTNDSTSFTDNFDDLVRFKTRSNISFTNDLQ